MALVLNLKYVDNLDNRCDRIMKINFRDFEKTTKVVRGKDSIYFGEQFQWPMGRKLDPIDTLELRLYQYSKYLNNKLIGSMTISLQKLLEDYKISYKENLIDSNHSIIRITVSFELTYYSPDSQIADWRQDEFENPITERKLSDADDISIDSHGMGSDKRTLIDPQTGEIGEFNYGQTDNESIESGEDDESFAATNARTLGVPLALHPTLHKTEDWQISITVIEARQLAGANINPLIEVRIGEKTKTTEVQMSTNSPYYNQYLCFEFHMSKAELFDQVIRLRCLAMGNMAISRLLPGDLIGEFRMDVRTVYNAPDHMFLHKWAMLVDPKDILSGAKGYVKVDLTIMGKGEQVKHKPKSATKKPKDNDDEDIEANLLLPQTIKTGTKRQMAEICVKIYKAEDLPRMNTDIMATIKMAITGDSKPLVDPFVQVSFAGHTGRTKVKKNTYTPEWNEEIVFTEMFPTLCNRIRVSVYDWDTVFNECIATHYIDLSQIMNEGDTGFLPTFGPSWVNLYGTPRNYTYDQMMRPKEELNRGLGEGVAYRGRLLIAIKTVLRSESGGLPAGAKVYSVPPISDGTCGKKEPFLLIGAFYEASVIDSEIGKKKQPIYFELSVGTTGNRLDSEANEEEEKEVPSVNQGNRPKIPKWCHSTTEPMLPDTNDQEYFHLSFNEKKPCLYMISYHEDHKSRDFIPNILEKLKNEFSNAVEILHELHMNERRGTHLRMKNALDTFIENIESSLNSIKCVRHVSPKTLLDKERIKLTKVCLEKMRVKAKTMYQDCTKANLAIRLKECRAIIKKLNELIPNPQNGLPDIFIWLIQDTKRMAFARIPAREILYSAIPEEKGVKNSEVVTVFLQKPGRFGMGPSGWTLQGQLKMYLWLGLLRDMKTFQQGLPLGYSNDCFKFRRPPMEIIYTEKSYFQLRAHMFMARNLIGSDESGLSDAFARILVNDHVVTTKVVYETLSPKWDQTLIIDHMIFYYSKDLIMSNPPVLVVEMFDEDQMTGLRSNQKGKSEFLGRCFCKPTVALEEEEYKSPRLTWWEIYRGQMNAGELLAAFELIQVFPDEGYRLANGIPRIEQMIRSSSPIGSLRSNSVFSQKELLLANMEGDINGDVTPNEGVTVTAEGHFVVPVPKEIRPSLVPYRVEFLFWGVREMQRVQLMSVDKPRITIEFGSSHLISDVIPSCKVKPNFSNPLKYMDIMLPENLLYWPPLMIQCEDLRQFGRTILIGNHVISNVTKYVIKGKIPTEEPAKKVIPNTSSPNQQNNLETPEDKIAIPAIIEGVDNPAYIEDETTAAGNLSSARKSSTNFNSNVQALLDNAKMLQDATQNSAVSQTNLNNSKAENSPEKAIQNARNPQSLKNTNLSQAGILMNSSEKIGKLDSQSINDTKLKNISPTPNTPPETPIHHPNYKDDKRPLVNSDTKSETKFGVKILKSIPEIVPVKPKESVVEPIKGLGVVELKKKAKIPKDELQDIDWWSRYYVSIEDLDDDGQEDSSDSNLDVLKDIEVDVKSDDDQGGLAEIPEDEEDSSKTKKKKKKRKKRKKSKKDKKKDGDKGIFAKLPFGRVDAAKKYLEEKDDDDLEDEDNVKPDYHNLIERFKVYPCPLEEVKEFEGFAAFIQTFPLQKGRQDDDEESSDNRIVGNFKGNLNIYKVDDEEFGVEVDVHKLMLYKSLPNNDPVQILVRIYVIRANDLHPADPNGKSDPYLLLRLGNKVINEKENYIPKQLNPIFGKCFELDVKFPQESNLLIQVMDWDLVSGDDIIGETKIDLENRYYSKHKALCGLGQIFENHGYNKWRDIQLPTMMLAKLCKEYGFDPPKYEALVNKVTVAEVAFYADAEIEEDNGEKKQSNEPLALEVMKNWSKVPNGCLLVPEHMETRPLFNSEKPGIQQGSLEMWIDMFPKELGAPPLPIDIAPRQPISYELRVIIWNTEDVILSDGGVLTGEKSSDIFVKGWMKGLGIDDQVTDVHYRSLSGEGNFNWRFIFNFDYIKAEDKIVYKIKDSPFAIDETEIKSPCKLYLQVWDADLVTADDFLGGLELILSKIPRGAKSPQTCGLHQLNKDGSVSTISIFKNKRYRGWWPFTGENEDDPKELDVNGKLDAEFQLLSKEEGEACPVGLGRNEPNALPSPNRPDSSFLNFMNPLKSLKYLICNKFKWFLIKALIISALLALLVLFIYNAPGYLAKRMLGA